MRKLLLEVTVNWEDYEDVDPELILEDTGIMDSLKEGVNVKLLLSKVSDNVGSSNVDDCEHDYGTGTGTGTGLMVCRKCGDIY